jgi:hypothetical protein
MEHDHLVAMLNRLKLTAIRDQLDSLIDEAARRELTIREALSLFCEKQPPPRPTSIGNARPTLRTWAPARSRDRQVRVPHTTLRD